MHGLIKAVLGTLSPAGTRARLSILIFHRVHAVADPLYPDEPDAARFAEILRWAKHWFNVVPLPEGIARLRTGTLPSRAAAITFDDGYADNCAVALPVLQQFGLHATFFVATGFLNGGRMWNDTVIEAVRATASELDLVAAKLGRYQTASILQKRETIETLINAIKYLPQGERNGAVEAVRDAAAAQLPADLMMSDEQVLRLRDAGMEIGAHTRSHPILMSCSASQAEVEIAGGRDDLAALLGRRPGLFAYPNGKPGRDYDPVHVGMARRMGFDAAVSTSRGAARVGDDLFQLPRFTPWARTGWRFAAHLAQNLVANPQTSV